MIAERCLANVRHMQVTSSMPGVTWAPPEQFTLMGCSPMMAKMMDKSWGARSQATLISFWNNPRLSRRAQMVIQARSLEIAHYFKLAIGQGAEIPNQVGAPVPAAS